MFHFTQEKSEVFKDNDIPAGVSHVACTSIDVKRNPVFVMYLEHYFGLHSPLRFVRSLDEFSPEWRLWRYGGDTNKDVEDWVIMNIKKIVQYLSNVRQHPEKRQISAELSCEVLRSMNFPGFEKKKIEMTNKVSEMRMQKHRFVISISDYFFAKSLLSEPEISQHFDVNVSYTW